MHGVNNNTLRVCEKRTKTKDLQGKRKECVVQLVRRLFCSYC